MSWGFSEHKLEWCASGNTMHGVIVTVCYRVDEFVPIATVVAAEMSQAGQDGPVETLHLTVGLWEVRGREKGSAYPI